MRPQQLVFAAIVLLFALCSGCTSQSTITTAVPETWLATTTSNPSSRINGTYQLFPVDVTDELGRQDRFNLYDLLFHPGSQMSGIRSYDLITLIEANGSLSVKVNSREAKEISATLQADKDYTRNHESVLITNKPKGDGESGRFSSTCTVTISRGADRHLLIRFEEKFIRTDLLLSKEKRNTDIWLRFAEK